jgi:DNA-binding protein HU-beta
VPKPLVTKTILAHRLAKTHGISINRAAALVEDFVFMVNAALSDGRTVRLAGLGVFKTIRRPSRKAHVPSTGEIVRVAARKRVFFRADAGFTATINA